LCLRQISQLRPPMLVERMKLLVLEPEEPGDTTPRHLKIQMKLNE
jgi:hypothetical protein